MSGQRLFIIKKDSSNLKEHNTEMLVSYSLYNHWGQSVCRGPENQCIRTIRLLLKINTQARREQTNKVFVNLLIKY